MLRITYREVDPERPAPGQIIREGTAQDGADDRGERVDDTDKANILATLAHVKHIGHDDEHHGHQTTGTNTRDAAANNQDSHRVGPATDGRADQEHDVGKEHGCLAAENIRELAVQGLGRGGGHHVSRAQPRDVPQGLELAGNGWD